MKRVVIITLVMMLALMQVAAAATAATLSPLEWDGVKGTDSTQECDDPKFGGDAGIHWVATGHDPAASNYNLTIYVDDVLVEWVSPDGIQGNNVDFYTKYYNWTEVKLNASLEFDGFMDSNADLKISHYCEDGNGGITEIPEFPLIALPVAAIIGLAFFFQRRKE
ncbi:PEF-CTERM sorting domain-containing protein [Methanolobus profundi]|uniref:PEF-CTERM protein sorting domain-containing protein n=1 Tax=Methanolobus profundi TaxID=487685 RepID=A0A1I4QX39_9EURY|nr:PEF-CTERM sorting domain-containing protein [Methanolobus profundi]SFM44652.1 PEF-CTERM protein sorting domain-containing protein [Methanolobus profundi]